MIPKQYLNKYQPKIQNILKVTLAVKVIHDQVYNYT